MKIELQRPRRRTDFSFNPKISTLQLTKSLPFFRSAFGSYVHRVRSGEVHYFGGEYSHTSFQFWCGNTGYYDRGSTLYNSRQRYRNSELFALPPDRSVSCATCEGRAIGAGLTESRIVAGRMLVFSPRR